MVGDLLERGRNSEEAGNDLDICFVCYVRKGRQTDHLFLHCEFYSILWHCSLSRCGVSWFFPCSLVDMFQGLEMVPFFGCSALLRRMIPCSMLFNVVGCLERDK